MQVAKIRFLGTATGGSWVVVHGGVVALCGDNQAACIDYCHAKEIGYRITH